MTVKYDVDRLKAILHDYTLITGLSIAVVDREQKAIASSVGENTSFCRCIQKDDAGLNKCICSDDELLKRCAKSGHPEYHICHAGLTDAAVPIMKNGTVLGYILLGRIRTGESLKEIAPRLSWLGDDFTELEKSYKALVMYDGEHFKSAVNLAVAVTSYILSDNMVTEKHNRLLEDTVSFIENNLSEDLSVDAVCRKMNVSKNLLYENFRIGLNTTLGEYVLGCRISRAAGLLSDTDKSISEICDEVGIANYTYFIKLFKKRTGQTPLCFRRLNR